MPVVDLRNQEIIMKRLITLCLLVSLAACAPEPEPPDYRELDIESLQALMEEGELSSERLTAWHWTTATRPICLPWNRTWKNCEEIWNSRH
jgi:hypothetical protein